MKTATSRKLVRGVGVNDAGYPVTIEEEIGGRRKVVWRCPFYLAWTHMLNRCYSAAVHARHPAYIGCSVSAEWLTFSMFRAWMTKQDWEGKHLDKDLLLPGNRVYGPDACVFISPALNLFLTDHAAARGDWPIGVDLYKGKYRANCRNPLTGKKEYLGQFDSPETAHEAWRKRKHELACMYAGQQIDQRIAAALRTRYSKPVGDQQ